MLATWAQQHHCEGNAFGRLQLAGKNIRDFDEPSLLAAIASVCAGTPSQVAAAMKDAKKKSLHLSTLKIALVLASGLARSDTWTHDAPCPLGELVIPV